MVVKTNLHSVIVVTHNTTRRIECSVKSIKYGTRVSVVPISS